MDANFKPGVDYIVQNYEGGFVNNKHDPGGATFQGVTQRVYSAFRAKAGRPYQSVQYMSIDERNDIYRSQFWAAIHGDDDQSGVDFALLDDAINSGPVGATKRLQQALGLKADGHWGLVTTQALANVKNLEGLIQTLCSLRLGFMQNLGTWRYFSGAWTRRVKDVERVALSVYNTGVINVVKAPRMGPAAKGMLDGMWTIVTGLVVACLPAALSYLAGVDWSKYMSTTEALFVSGLLMAVLRVLQNTPTKLGAKL